MILSVLIIIVIALAAFRWGNQRALSALLHMHCALAGAVGFVVEPLAFMFLNAGGLPEIHPSVCMGAWLGDSFYCHICGPARPVRYVDQIKLDLAERG